MGRRKKAGDDKPKVRMPRQKRDKIEPEDDGGRWILRSGTLMEALKIVNHHKERPYWMSIPHKGGVEPVAGFFPCSFFRHGNRVYYGFLVRNHREALCERWTHGRRELTERVARLRS